MPTYKDYTEFWVATYIGKIGHVTLLVLGTIGNVLSMAIWIRNRKRMVSSIGFLVALAVVDLVVLLSGSIRHAVRNLTDPVYDIRVYHSAVCKLNTYLTMAGGQVSAWILVAITIERVISVASPLKVGLLCTSKRHGIIISIILVVLGGLNAQLLYGFDVYAKTNTSAPRCTRTTEYNQFYLDVFVYFHFFSLCIVPIAILLIGNIFIIVQTRRVRQSTISSESRSSQSGSNPGAGAPSSRISALLTRRVVILSITFFICNAPYTLYALLYDTWVSSNMSAHEIAIDYLVAQLSIVLVYANNAVNFYLYCAVGTKFRQDVKALFFGKKTRRRNFVGMSASNVHTETSTTSSGQTSIRY